jgi:uncharacterized OB-fold protein
MTPVTDDRDTGGFFREAAERRLVFRSCRDCGHGIHPPVPHCPYCGSATIEWRRAAGTGRLHAWTTVMHQIHPDYPAPYTVVVVSLDDTPDVRLVGHLDGAPDLQIGQKMEVSFEARPDGVVLPQWRPLAQRTGAA